MSFLNSLKGYRLSWLWLVTVFLLSGLIINCVQILLLPLWYVSHNTFRRINAVLCYLHWSMLTFLGEWWGQMDIKFYGKKEDYEKIGKEHALVLPNHRSDIDWLIGWIICERTGILGGAKCYIKSSVKFLPVVGWMWWCAEYVFLRRNWEADLPILQNSLEQMRDYPIPFFLGIFPEGTRFTKKKHENSLEFARSRGLPQLNYHLFPRTKGVSITLKYLQNVVPAVYNIEAAYPAGSIPTIKQLLSGGRCEAHLLIKRIPIEDVPCNSNEEVSAWCQQLFVEKDKDMTEFVKNGSYLADRVDLPRRKTNLVIVLFWNILLVVPVLFGLSSLFRAGFLVSVPTLVGFLIVAYVVIRVLIRFTDSERGSKFGLQNGSKKEQESEVKNGMHNKTN